MILWTEREREAEPRNKQEGALVIGAGQRPVSRNGYKDSRVRQG